MTLWLRAASEGSSRVRRLRRHLQSHLARSQVLDPHPLLRRLHATHLWQEQVLLHSRVGCHPTSLPERTMVDWTHLSGCRGQLLLMLREQLYDRGGVVYHVNFSDHACHRVCSALH